MRKITHQRILFVWITTLILYLIISLTPISLTFISTALYAKEVAPQRIYGNLVLDGMIVTDIDNYLIQVRLTRNNVDYIVAHYNAGSEPLYGDYYIVDVPLDDSFKEGVPAPGDKVDIIVNRFVMAQAIALDVGQIRREDIHLCHYTELSIAIEGVKAGGDYQEDVLPIILTWGCGVSLTATLNGGEYIPGTWIHEPNHYILVVLAEDASGKTKQAQVSFTKSTLWSDTLSGEFTNGLSGWTVKGNVSSVSLTDKIIMGPGGYAALIDVPGPSEYAIMSSDLIYVHSDSVVDLSFYLYGKAQDEVLLSVTTFTDQKKQNPVSLITDEKIHLTVNDRWQKISSQLIIPEGEYFIEVSIGRTGETVAHAPLAIDKMTITPIHSITTKTSYDTRLWFAVEERTRNLLAGADDDLGIFVDGALATVANIPNSTCGIKTLRLKNTQVIREVYLKPGDYTLGFDLWSTKPQEVSVQIGPEMHTLITQSLLNRHSVEYTMIDEGWCSIRFINQGDSDLYLTRIQLEEGSLATCYTSSGRSDGYFRFSLPQEERIDFGGNGMFSFVFSPIKKGGDLFLAGAKGWGIEYKETEKGIIFSMEGMSHPCVVNLGPDGIMANVFYKVTLSWNSEKIALDIYNISSHNQIGLAESTVYNRNIQFSMFFIGSKLIAINQSHACNCIFGYIQYETNLGSGSIHLDASCTERYKSIYTTNAPPSAPSVYLPPNLTEAHSSMPILSIHNSIDQDGDPLLYEYEIYPNRDLTPPAIASVSLIQEGDATTSWQCLVSLQENSWYSWHARAFDGLDYGPWMDKSVFFVNVANDSPSIPVIQSPLNLSEVTVLKPNLIIENSHDPDDETITYDFEVYSNPAMTNLVTSALNIPEAMNDTSWTLPVNLNDNSWYYWRVRASDGEDFSAWAMGSFFVNKDGIDDPPMITITEPSAPVSVDTGIFIIKWEDSDPDSNADIALYYDVNNIGEKGIVIKSGLKEDSDGVNDSFQWDIAAISEGTYYVYAVITDAHSSRTSYGKGTITKSAINIFYRDQDEDGYGDPHQSIKRDTLPIGYAPNKLDCDDTDPNKNPGNINIITFENKTLQDFKMGRNIIKILQPSCYPYNSYDLLSDFRTMGYTLYFSYWDQNKGVYKSSYWFFNKVCGDKIEFPEYNSNLNETDNLYIIDRIQ